MAYHPRMTRLGLRITIAALEVYLPQLHGEVLTSAANTLKELQYNLDSANIEKYGRAAQEMPLFGPKKALPGAIAKDEATPSPDSAPGCTRRQRL